LENGFSDIIEVVERYDDLALSFTDPMIVAVVERFDIDRMLRFDDVSMGRFRKSNPEMCIVFSLKQPP
jgi:predicted nucleic acid-binding protein